MINNKELFDILHKIICTKSRSQFKFKYGWLPAKKNVVQPWTRFSTARVYTPETDYPD